MRSEKVPADGLDRAADLRAERGRAIGSKSMPKGYWITTYRSVADPARLARYAGIAGPTIEGLGGKILARGIAVRAYEDGIAQRAVVIEFESVERAIAAY